MSEPTAGRVPEQMGLGRSVAFSIAGVPVTAVDIALLIYLPPHLSGHLGVPLTVVGICWAVVRLLDIIVDPLLGVAIDATRSRFGRYRLWMVLGAPILMAATWMLFFAKPGIGAAYLIGWLLALYLGRSILHMAHPAWASTLARTYNERARLFGVLAAVTVATSLVVLSLPVINAALSGGDARNIVLMGWFVLLSAPLTIGLAVWRTGERLNPNLASERAGLSDYLQLLIKPDLMRLYLAATALTLGPGWMSSLYLFFMEGYNGLNASQASILLLVYTVAGLAGAPLMAGLATRIGKHGALMAATTGYSLGLCTVLFTPYGSLLGAMPTMIWCGFMGVGFELIIRAMLADVADQVRLEQGRERLSLIFALNTLTTKIATAAAVAITFPLLQYIGYSPKAGTHNSAAAIQGLGLTFALGPIVFVMLGGACLIGWKLNAARHSAIRAELDLRDAAAAADAGLGSPAES
ncbi:MFS transporter [Phenylobacterium sp.]|uniref:MFS transporter n=1 Tax=Phenylobacterium sp. TaxID=1871053 RepID=UPI00356534AE